MVAFQSRLGKAEWLKPYADETIAELGRSGLERLDVLCPGFAADCLETLEETAMQNRDIFREAGGGDLHYIPALNARGGWPESSPDWSESEAARERDKSRERALAMGADR
jgi:ferrochelatase